MILDISKHNLKVRKELDFIESLKVESKNSSSRKIKQSYIDWIYEYEYCYFVTFTFQYEYTVLQGIQHINKLMRYVNEQIFGKRYFKKNVFLDGFVVVEKHESGLPHYHMIIKKDSKIDMKGRLGFKDIFEIQSKKVTMDVGTSGIRIFGTKSIDIRKIYSDDIVGYVTKDIWKSRGNTVFPLSRVGILYTDLDGYH